MSDNSAAIAALDEAIARIERTGNAAEAIAPEVARHAKELIDANIAAGRAPDGTPWKLTAKGEKPLKNAASHVTAEAHGTRIVLTVTGPEAFHHRGRTRGNIVRAILPSKKLPTLFVEAIKKTLASYIAGH